MKQWHRSSNGASSSGYGLSVCYCCYWVGIAIVLHDRVVVGCLQSGAVVVQVSRSKEHAAKTSAPTPSRSRSGRRIKRKKFSSESDEDKVDDSAEAEEAGATEPSDKNLEEEKEEENLANVPDGVSRGKSSGKEASKKEGALHEDTAKEKIQANRDEEMPEGGSTKNDSESAAPITDVPPVKPPKKSGRRRDKRNNSETTTASKENADQSNENPVPAEPHVPVEHGSSKTAEVDPKSTTEDTSSTSSPRKRYRSKAWLESRSKRRLNDTGSKSSSDSEAEQDADRKSVV